MSGQTFHHGLRPVVADVAVYGVAFGLTALIAYLYVVGAGRMLPADDFGVFNALSGLVTIAGSFAVSLQLAVTQAAVLSQSRSALTAFMRGTWRFSLPIVTLATFAVMPLAPMIGANAAHVALCGVAVLATFLGCTAMGFLAGIGRIRAQAGVTLSGTVARLATGWPLMFMGAGVTGAMLGFVINNAVILVLAYWISWQVCAVGASGHSGGTSPVRLRASAIATYVFAYAPFSLDQLQVQVFAASYGGDYAALATMAKLVFFSSYPIIAVAYPRLLARPDQRGRLQLVAAASVAVLFISGGLAGVLASFPGPLTQIFFGERFQQIVPHVGSLAFGLACFSISVLGAQVLITWGSPIGFLPSLVALSAGVFLFAFRHDSLGTLVANQVWVNLLQVVLVLALLAVTIGRSLKHRGTVARR